jgi:hypothetical protein
MKINLLIKNKSHIFVKQLGNSIKNLHCLASNLKLKFSTKIYSF